MRMTLGRARRVWRPGFLVAFFCEGQPGAYRQRTARRVTGARGHRAARGVRSAAWHELYTGTSAVGAVCDGLRTEAEEGGEAFVEGRDFRWRQLAVDAADAALIDGAEVIDEGEGGFGESADAGGERGIKKTLASGAGDGHDADQREALVGDHLRITHDDAGPYAALFVAERGIEFDDYYGATFHVLAQPTPGVHSTACPADGSSRDSASSWGRVRSQSASP
jgi:hypothetical protein